MKSYWYRSHKVVFTTYNYSSLWSRFKRLGYWSQYKDADCR